VAIRIIHSCISDDLRSVDSVIRQSLHSEVPLVNQVAEYIVSSGGKRLRPILVLLSGGLFGGLNPVHHQLAAIVELIHTSTLLHDDVVDESSKRRGKSTANALFGNAASVLVGDFVYSRTFQMMVGIKNMRVMEVLSNATNIIAEGEVLQLLNINNADITDEDYLKVIHYKTAKLFEAASQLGAIISNANADDESALSLYGMHLGTAFQLVDDILDLSGNSDEIGKNLGDDLAEGKPTLPILYAMRNSAPELSEKIRLAIEQGGIEHLPLVIDAVNQSGALIHVKKLAELEAEKCRAAIAHFPDSEFKHAMIALTEFAVTRSF
jgi:octaprenyl-diphosphate synthase